MSTHNSTGFLAVAAQHLLQQERMFLEGLLEAV